MLCFAVRPVVAWRHGQKSCITKPQIGTRWLEDLKGTITASLLSEWVEFLEAKNATLAQ